MKSSSYIPLQTKSEEVQGQQDQCGITSVNASRTFIFVVHGIVFIATSNKPARYRSRYHRQDPMDDFRLHSNGLNRSQVRCRIHRRLVMTMLQPKASAEKQLRRVSWDHCRSNALLTAIVMLQHRFAEVCVGPACSIVYKIMLSLRSSKERVVDCWKLLYCKEMAWSGSTFFARYCHHTRQECPVYPRKGNNAGCMTRDIWCEIYDATGQV